MSATSKAIPDLRVRVHPTPSPDLVAIPRPDLGPVTSSRIPRGGARAELVPAAAPVSAASKAIPDSPVRVRTTTPSSDLVAVPHPDLGPGAELMIPRAERGELVPAAAPVSAASKAIPDSPVRVRTTTPSSDLVAVPRPDLGPGAELMIPRAELGEARPRIRAAGRNRTPAQH